MTPTVYLAGPIAGCTEGEAKDWRAYVDDGLSQYGIKGISPLRCEPLHGKTYNVSYQDPKYGTERAIFFKNKFDLERCDMMLAYLPQKTFGASIGTLAEISWAYKEGKPSILVSDREEVLAHPMTHFQTSWILPTLDDAIEVIGNVLGAYTPGGKHI
jgi:nucleoside 2-deoxyribosyltransferase